MASESDLIPLYTGRISGFTCNALKASFSLVDRFIFELPKIPTTLITRTSHPNAPSDVIGKPQPLVMGRWNFEPSGGDFYKPNSFVPAYVVENNMSTASPQLVLEICGHAIKAVEKVYVFDDALSTVCEIVDTITEDLSGPSTLTIDLRDYDPQSILTTIARLYPDRGYGDPSGTEIGQGIDGNFDTYCPIMSGEYGIFNFPDTISELDDFELTPIMGQPSNYEAIGLAYCQIQISGYPDDAFGSSEGVTVEVVNSRYTVSLPYTFINSLSDVSNFNITLDADPYGSDLKITYPDVFKGAGEVGSTPYFFAIKEADDASGTNATSNVYIFPNAGNYYKMSMVAREAERVLNVKTDDGEISNRYTVIYNKLTNKMSVKRTAGSKYFAVFGYVTGFSHGQDFGFTRTSDGGWVNDEYEGEETTILDVPDGDFSFLQIRISNTSEAANFRVKGVRVTMDRRFRAFNPSPNKGNSIEIAEKVRANRDYLVRSPLGRALYNTFKDVRKPVESFYDAERSILDALSTSKFFVTLDGYETGAEPSSYYTYIPEIIQAIIGNYLSLSSLVDSTSFSAAASDNTSGEFCLYLPTQTETKEVLFNLARYMPGFLAVSQEGKFVLYAKKEEYFAVDVDWTLYPYDIKAPFSDNFTTSRTPISQIGKEVNFDYCYNWATGKFGRSINRSTTNDLNLEPITITCEYVNNDNAADAVARLFSGVTSTYDFFGRMRRIITFTVLDPEWHLAELGDIVKLSSDFDSIIKVFGRSATDVHYMITAKQDFKNQVVITAEEVQVA